MDALSFNPLQSGVAADASRATGAPLPDGGGASTDFAALLALGMNPAAKTAPQTDAPLPASGLARIDYSALLATGMNPEINTAPQTEAPLPASGLARIDYSALLATGMNPEVNTAPQADALLLDDDGASIDLSQLALGLNPAEAKTASQLANETPENEETSALPQHLAEIAPQSLIALPQPLPVADIGTQVTTALDAMQVELEPADAGDMTPIGPAATSADGRTAVGAGATAAVVADAPANIAGDASQPVHLKPFGGENQSIEQRADAIADLQQAATLETRLPAEALAPAAAHTHVAQMHPAESRAPLSQPSALLEVQAPVSEPGFAQALSRQVVWMVDKDAQVAELRINPPELGPVEVRLTLTQDSAAAEFVSPHAEVRAAIENAIVRLRESLADAGIQLGEASVSAESFSDRANGEAQPRMARDGYRDAPPADHAASRSSGRRAVAHGLVDVFA